MVKKKEADSSVVKLSEVKPISFVSSGIKEIDDLVGGFPRARVTQVYGLAGTGKTSLMVKCLAAISASGASVLYCDVENAINTERVKEMGADASKIAYTNKAGLEEVCELIRQSLGKYDLIILDSVAMLTPRTEHEGEIGQANVGLKPRLLGQWLRMITEDLGRSKTALVLVNQMRRTMELWGEKYVLPGGMQLKFSSSLMLQLSTKKADKIEKNGETIGHRVSVLVTKNKLGKPDLSTVFELYY